MGIKKEVRFFILLLMFGFGVGFGFSLAHLESLTKMQMEVCEDLFINHTYIPEV